MRAMWDACKAYAPDEQYFYTADVADGLLLTCFAVLCCEVQLTIRAAHCRVHGGRRPVQRTAQAQLQRPHLVPEVWCCFHEDVAQASA